MLVAIRAADPADLLFMSLRQDKEKNEEMGKRKAESLQSDIAEKAQAAKSALDQHLAKIMEFSDKVRTITLSENRGVS
jgi:hypothetical protein